MGDSDGTHEYRFSYESHSSKKRKSSMVRLTDVIDPSAGSPVHITKERLPLENDARTIPIVCSFFVSFSSSK